MCFFFVLYIDVLKTKSGEQQMTRPVVLPVREAKRGNSHIFKENKNDADCIYILA